jgi:transposase
MFNLNNSMRYWLYPQPTDMRKGFYTLSGLVTDHMGQNVRSGDVFIFLNRHCTSLKALHMEHGGLVIYYMKLEKGNFTLPSFDENGSNITINNLLPKLRTQERRNNADRLLPIFLRM